MLEAKLESSQSKWEKEDGEREGGEKREEKEWFRK